MDSEDAARIERIKAKLADLRQLDPACELFGSGSHRYRLGPPLTASELADCEKELGVSLPSEYRDFVMEVGHGGAGPFYGLFQLTGSEPENITDLDQIKKPFRWTDATNSMKWQNPETEEASSSTGMGIQTTPFRCGWSFRESCISETTDVRFDSS